MIVTVRLNYYSELIEKDEVQIQLQDGGALRDLIYQLKELFPAIIREADNAKYIVDGRLAGPESVLFDGSEVNMLLPLAGG